MDLKDLKPKDAPVVVTIKHPITKEVLKNEDGTDMTVTMLHPYSKEYREVMYERADARIEQARKNGNATMKAKDADMASVDALARTTASWNITYDGKNPKLTVAKATEVYDDLRWMKLQIEEELDGIEVFT